MEELQTRHRKELRDLQSRMTQKKKQANKKTRKGVNDECDRLEADLKDQQQAEILALGGEPHETESLDTSNEAAGGMTLQQSKDEEPTIDTAPSNATVLEANSALAADSETKGQGKKPNRQKARLAKRAAEQEELSKKASEEAKDLPDKKQQERDRMLGYMNERGLVEKEIRADGHCLYSAVADQLAQLQTNSQPSDSPTISYKAVRTAAADYIQDHQDDFVPFLEESLAGYLHKVRDTGEWGGQLELMALAKSYGININVLQDFGRVEKIEAAGRTDGKEMWLGYYKHGFGLGEHYNSLRKVP